MLAGFWQTSSSWALPRDAHGGGYWQLARENTAQIGFCLLFVFASGWGQTFLLSIFQPHWVRELGLDAAGVGLIYGGATLASGLLLPWLGPWLDRASAARAGTITLLGLATFSLLAAAVSDAAMLAIALFGLRFFGQGLSANVGTVNAARWFYHNRGKAISVAALGFPLGEAVLPAVVTVAALTAGWRITWCGLAAICVLIFVPVARRLAARHPQAVVESRRNHLQEDLRARQRRRAVLRDTRFVAMLGMMAPLPFVMTGLIFFQATLAEQRAWSSAVIATGFAIFAGVRAVCSLSAGAWVDRLGAVRMLALPSCAAALGLAFLLRPEPLFAFLFFVANGVAFGSSGAITTAAWAEMFGAEQIGTIRAMSSSFAIFLTAAAPVCFGFVLSGGASVDAVILGCALLMLLFAWPFSVLVRRIHRARSGS